MPAWISNFLLVIAGFITGFFISPASVHFEVFQMIIAVFIFATFIIVLAFWPQIKSWFRKSNNQ